MTNLGEFDLSPQEMEGFLRSTDITYFRYSDFGFPDVIEQILSEVYKTEVIVTPKYIIFDHAYFYSTPAWIAGFMRDVVYEDGGSITKSIAENYLKYFTLLDDA